MPAAFAVKGGKGTFDDARTEAQATRGQQAARLAQVGQQALHEAGTVASLHQGKLIAGGVQHMERMGEAEAIGIKVGLEGGLMHPGPHGVVRQEQSIEFLIEQFRRLTAQGLLTEPLMGFDLINDQFNLRAFVIEADELEGGSLHRVE